MQLTDIELVNFRSHKKTVLDLTSFESVVIIGKNGAGKSTFAYGFCYGFWGDIEGIKISELIKTNADDMHVAIGFIHDDGNKYKVVRGVKVTGVKKKTFTSHLSLLQQNAAGDMVDVSGNSISDTTKQISAMLGDLKAKTAIHSNFDLQGESSRFMQASASDRRRLFEDILNLQIYETLEKNARAKAKEAKTILQGLDIDDEKEAVLENEIKDIEAKSGSLKKKVEDLQKILDELAKRIHDLQAIVEGGTKNLDDQKSPLLEQIVKIQADLVVSQKKLADFDSILAEKDTINTEYEKLQEKNKELKNAQDARQAYTIAVGEKKALSGTLEFTSARLSKSQKELVENQTAVSNESMAIQKKHEIESDDIESWMSSRVVELKTEQGTNSANRAKYQKELEANMMKQNDLMGDIATLSSNIKSISQQVEKIESAGALCPVFNKACEKLTQEQRDAELESLAKERKDKEGKKAGLVEQQESCKADNKRLSELINKAIDTDKRLGQSILRLENDIEGFARLKVSAQKEIEELGVAIKDDEVEVVRLGQEIEKTNLAIEKTGFNPEEYSVLENAIKALEAGGWQEKREKLVLAEATISDLKEKIEGLQQREKDIKSQVSSIEALLEIRQKEIEKAKNDMEATNAVVSENKTKKAEMSVELSELFKKLGISQTLLNQMREQKNKSIQYQQRLVEFGILEKTYKKARALIVENSVPKFQELCNEILDYLEVSIRVRIETLEETKDSRTKEIKLVPTFKIIVVDGKNGVERDYNTWSGGEKQRINLAIRQALSTILLNRAGTKMDLIIIDESDSALDDAGKDALIRLVQANVEGRFGRAAKVMCITHTEDIKDSFPVRILVEMVRGSSKVIEVQ